MALGDLLWLAVVLLGLVVVIVAPRVAWYVLVSYRQQARYAKQVGLVASGGVPPPEPPPPPNLWRVQYRFGLIGGALGLAGGLIAIVMLVMSSHR
jgi:hypothetical protein